MEIALLMENKRRKTETKSRKVSNYNENQIRPGTRKKQKRKTFSLLRSRRAKYFLFIIKIDTFLLLMSVAFDFICLPMVPFLPWKPKGRMMKKVFHLAPEK
jgi:hypothetical protein